MFLFVFGIIIAVIAVLAITGAVFSDRTSRNPKTWIILAGVFFILLAGAGVWNSFYRSVPTKSVGVVTSYGKVTGVSYGPGRHEIDPWRTLNIVQDTIASDSFLQSNSTGGTNASGTSTDVESATGITGTCITVRLGGQQEGCADVQLKAQVEEDAIASLFANYSSYGPNLSQDVNEFVVKQDLVTALNHTLGDYNPVADVSQSYATTGKAPQSQFSQFDSALLTAMQADLQGQVKVISLNLQYVHYDSETQSRINQIATQYASTQVAVQQEKTNAAISAANAALVKQSQGLTPAVLLYDCYQTVQMAIKAGYNGLPQTFCGGSASVLINGK